MKKIIISASRRTDIPAYYADWFFERLKKGFTFYSNPYSNKLIYVNLRPNYVQAFVFWTRNPYPLFKYLDYIDDVYNSSHYMHITINGQPKEFEIRNPKTDFVIKYVEKLAYRYGKHYVQWRYDPIILSSLTNELYIYDKFEELAKKLSPIVNKCITSFVDFYNKTKKNLYTLYRNNNIQFYDPNRDKKIKIIKNLQDIAKNYKLNLEVCTEPDFLQEDNIIKTHCIDLELVRKVSNDPNFYSEISPTREACQCFSAKDIGYFNSCPHGCLYCYANKDPEVAFQNSKIYRKTGFKFDDFNEPDQEIDLFG
jgi:hypothetical protein